MPARDLSEQLKIETPCTANWDQMIGNEWVRFCEHCQLMVNDLTPLTPKRVRRLIANSKGRLCVRYRLSPEGAPLLKAAPQQLHQIRTRVSKIAAGAFTTMLSISSATSQPTIQTLHQHPIALKRSNSALAPVVFGASIKGTVTDPAGAVVPGANLKLGMNEQPDLYGATTNGEGAFSFEGLEPGAYKLSIEAPGFKKSIISFEVLANETKEVSSSLEVDGESVTVGGAMIALPLHPLLRAAFEDDLETFERLLTRENVNERDENTDATALEYALRNGSREMLQLLLRSGADVNTRNSFKQTPLMLLGDESTDHMVWDLIHAGAKVNLKDEYGDTALMEAAREKNLPVLMALLNAGARVDTKNKEGETALMLAAYTNQIANIRALIRAGADLNARDNDGWTALDYATNEGNELTINLLRSSGAIAGERPVKN